MQILLKFKVTPNKKHQLARANKRSRRRIRHSKRI